MLSSGLMRQPGASHRLEILVQAAIVGMAAILLFWELTEKDLWQDEAATAVLATRMLRFGRPLAYDGVNLLTIDMQDEDDDASLALRTGDPKQAIQYFSERGDFKPDTTWKWQPWGLFAIAAASIEILGRTTLAARLPFALAGLATVWLLFRLVRRQFDSFLMAALSAVLLISNSYWILHARQCRYYSVSSLFLVLTLAGYARWQWGGRSAAGFIAAAWCWFQVDYGTVLPVLAVLFLEAFLADWRAFRRTVTTGLILAAALAPFVYFYDLAHRGSDAEGTWGERFLDNLFNVNEYVAPVIVVLAALGLLVWRWKSLAAAERRLVTLACGIILAFTLWIPTVTVYSFVRYSIPAATVGALVTAWVAVRALGRYQRFAWLAAAVLIVTPWASLPMHALAPPPDWWSGSVWYRSELQDLRAEIFGHQPDPNRIVIDWLRKNAKPTDEILINYEDFPLMYYLPNPIRGGIATFRAEDDARTPPAFVVLRRSVPFVHKEVFDREVKRYLWQQVPLKAPDIMWGNNPDPMGDDDPNAAPNLYIGRRVDLGRFLRR
jgi:hypothetical protein